MSAFSAASRALRTGALPASQLAARLGGTTTGKSTRHNDLYVRELRDGVVNGRAGGQTVVPLETPSLPAAAKPRRKHHKQQPSAVVYSPDSSLCSVTCAWRELRMARFGTRPVVCIVNLASNACARTSHLQLAAVAQPAARGRDHARVGLVKSCPLAWTQAWLALQMSVLADTLHVHVRAQAWPGAAARCSVKAQGPLLTSQCARSAHATNRVARTIRRHRSEGLQPAEAPYTCGYVRTCDCPFGIAYTREREAFPGDR